MLISQRRPDPDEMDGVRMVMVMTEVERGLPCERCGRNTRVDTHVRPEVGLPVIATLTGCSTCRTGLYE